MVLVLVGDLLAQSGDTPPARPPATPAVDEVAALADLTALGNRHRAVNVLTASYVQRRTSAILQEPLVTRGQLAFRRRPGCVVFRTEQPRPTVVRLDEQTYQVFRPERKRLERFLLESPELPRSLFLAFTADVEVLRRDYQVTGFERHGEGQVLHTITLEPKLAAIKQRLHQLRITLDGKTLRLHAVAYRDAAKDLVEIELDELTLDPKVAPAFDLVIPPDTEIMEHAAKKPG